MNTNENAKPNRRRLFQMGLSAVAALPLLRATSAFAEDSCPTPDPDSKYAKAKKIDPKSGNAKRLDYVNNAADAKDHNKFKEGSNCGNCRFFRVKTSKESDKDWAPCTMLANRYVPSCGWCKQYNRDPKTMKKS